MIPVGSEGLACPVCPHHAHHLMTLRAFYALQDLVDLCGSRGPNDGAPANIVVEEEVLHQVLQGDPKAEEALPMDSRTSFFAGVACRKPRSTIVGLDVLWEVCKSSSWPS